MAEVATVRGSIDAADLGTTLMHEHVFILTADVQQNFPARGSSSGGKLHSAS